MKRKDIIAGIILLIGLITWNTISMGLPVMGLNLGLLIAFTFWLKGRYRIPFEGKGIVQLFLFALVVQSLHIAEEYLTGFYIAFPQIFGSDPWTGRQFLFFNITWMILFGITVYGIIRKKQLAYLILWFFVLGGELLNGGFHLAISLIRVDYFPGLITGTLHVIVGSILLNRMIKATSRTSIL